jgi:hypothetical protein
MFKIISKITLVLGCLVSLSACSGEFVTWREEVKLNDGRVIVVEQKKRDVEDMDREAWLTINLPEFSTKPIVWHENLRPLTVNIDGGRLYVVGFPPTGVEGHQYGCPRPPYVGFVWENGTWNRIPFEGIPERIYTTNMLTYRFPPRGTTLLTLEEKNGSKLNGDLTVPPGLKKINPKLGNFGCY